MNNKRGPGCKTEVDFKMFHPSYQHDFVPFNSHIYCIRTSNH